MIKELELRLKAKAKIKGYQKNYYVDKSKKLKSLIGKQDDKRREIIVKFPRNKSISTLDKLGAYAVFESPKVKTKMVRKFALANRIHIWHYDALKKKYRLGARPNKYKFYKHHIHIKTAPDPTEIIWENLEIPVKNVIFRKILVIFFVMGLLILGGVGIYIIRVYKSTIADTRDGEEMGNKKMDDLETEKEINCFCSTKTLTVIIDNKKFRELGWDYIFFILYRQLIIVLISMLIFLINELIEMIFVKLSSFSRNKYLTSMNKELTVKIFVLMYLNTGVLIFLSDFDISVWPLTYFIEQNRRYKDTAKDWFIESGNSLFALMIMNICGYGLINLLKATLK